jgi:lipopolysaccharide/colanic/teichoic acid biosynthesis glycosyltransferase
MRRATGILMYTGIAAIILGFSKVHSSWIADPAYDFSQSFRLPWALTFVAILAAAAYSVGLPDVPHKARQIAAATLAAVILASAGISALQLLVGSPLLPRFVIAASAAAALVWLPACAVLARGGRARARSRDRVVVIGAQEDSTNLPEELRRAPERPARVVEIVAPVDARPSVDDPMPVRTLVETHDATVVVLDREAQASQPIVDQVALLHERGVRVRTLSLFYEQWLGKLPIGELERVSLMFDIGEVHRLRYSRLKRLMDVSIAAALLPVLVVVTPLVMLANLAGNRGPLFFRQERVGKGGAIFRIHKFRTMRPSPGFADWTEIDDDRVTRFGALLRAAHLDELPQIVNVLRGELSVVGPRPEQVHYVEQLEAKLPYYQLRHLVQPGLTGWAQVKYGYARSEDDALEKLQFEFYYLRRQALAVDLRILVRTLRTVLPLGGPRWQ